MLMNNITKTVKNEIKKQFGTADSFAESIGIPTSEINSVLENGVENSAAQTVFKILNELKIRSELFLDVNSEDAAKKLLKSHH